MSIDPSNNPNYNCKRGWIISMDEAGGYVPFFVRVRSEDIMWTTKAIDRYYSSIERNLRNFGYTYNADIQNPSAEMVVNVGNWTYYIKPNGQFRAKYIGIPSTSDYSIIKTPVSLDRDVTAGANLRIDLPLASVKSDTMIIGNMDPIGSCYTYFKGARHKSYSIGKIIDTIDISIRCTYDLEVVSDFNARAIDTMIETGEGVVVSIYMEGTISI